MVASLWYAVEGLYDLKYKALPLGDSLWGSNVKIPIKGSRRLGVGLRNIPKVDPVLRERGR